MFRFKLLPGKFPLRTLLFPAPFDLGLCSVQLLSFGQQGIPTLLKPQLAGLEGAFLLLPGLPFLLVARV